MSSSQLYFDFLLLCEKNRVLINNMSAHVSQVALALFIEITRRHEANHAMTISEAMDLKHMASSAALHRRIDDLREAGMVCVFFKDESRRSKYLCPTEKGQKYLQLMGRLLYTAAHT
jgi:hypothetical protein